MGLAGPRKRRKLAKDPNNTAWTRATDNYGQRILASQGWTPGSFLGAQDAPHADHYSAASASHIRVALKEDTLGLGASRSLAEVENTGLGNFQDLLGRLNGKQESQIEKEKEARKTLGAKLYTQQRWGSTRFIRAGFLVGDRIEQQSPSQTPLAEHPRESTDSDASKTQDPGLASSVKARDKHERRQAKEERRQRRQERRARREERRAQKEVTTTEGMQEEQVEAVAPGVQAPQAEPASETDNGRQPEAARRSGINVRQRYLQQKRKAMLDPQAMREILMIKTPAAVAK